jgi:hypothetical protein
MVNSGSFSVTSRTIPGSESLEDPPGSYVGIDSRFGLKGGPTLSGRAAVACDYDDAARLWEFAERETGTTLSL